MDVTPRKWFQILVVEVFGISRHIKCSQKIFFRIEHHFRQLSPDGNLQSVNIKGITDKSVTDSELLVYYNLMVSDSELVPATHVIKDVLHAIFILFIFLFI